MSRWHQLGLFLTRNRIAKGRNIKELFAEMLLPVFFTLLLVLLDRGNKSNIFPEYTSNTNLLAPFSFNDGTNKVVCYAPSSLNVNYPNDVDKIMKLLAEDEFIWENNLRGFATESDLIKYYDMFNPSHPNNFNVSNKKFFVGFIFSEVNENGKLSDDVKVRIRINSSEFESPVLRFSHASLFVKDGHWQYLAFLNPFLKNFISLQERVMNYIINFRLGYRSHFLTTIQAFPFKEFINSFLKPATSYPFYLLVGFLGLVSKASAVFVAEKENKIKEGMKIFGLHTSIWYLGWWITYLCLNCVTCAIISFLLVYLGVLGNTSVFVIFLLTLVYAQSLVMLSFFVSSFFNKSKMAGNIASMISILLYLPSYIIDDSSSIAMLAVACLSPPIAFSQAASALFDANENGIRVYSYSKFLIGLLMMLFDILMYFCFTYYIDSLYPGEYGTPKRWYFIFQKDFWCANSEEYFELSDSVENSVFNNLDLSSDFIEPVGEELRSKEKVSLIGVRKVFDTSNCWKSSETVAIEQLDLRIFEGQIFVLLGHNGCGKTTTFSVLNGLTAPTSGEVNIYGMNHMEMDSIRKSLGVCPQHDILFDNLTVLEHLNFYGGLRELRDEQLALEIARLLNELELEDKLHAMATSLSGGQKRKLSIAMALIGGPRVLLLDEPTAGMDPVSRRKVWNLLKKYRKDRVIILTTHYMDEADLLGDRIAIMSKGRLKCIGSSLFLKSKFGSGYSLHIEKSSQDFKYEEVKKLTEKSIPGSSVVSNVAGELTFTLPLDSRKYFSSYFTFLESPEATLLGVRSFGVSLTTLEEVFLKIAQEEEEVEAIKSGNITDTAVNATYQQVSSQNFEIELKTLTNSDDVTSSASYNLNLQQNEEDFNIFTDIPNRASLTVQFMSMFRKKIILSFRDYYSLFLLIVPPCIYTIIMLLILRSVDTRNSTSLIDIDMNLNAVANSALNFEVNNIESVVSNSSLFLRNLDYKPNIVSNVFNSIFNDSKSENSYVAANLKALSIDTANKNAWLSQAIYFNGSFVAGAAAMHATMINTFYKSLGLPGSISTTSAPLPNSSVSRLLSSVLTVALMPLMVGMASVYMSVAFGIAVVKEKASKAKHVQFVMGVRPVVFWFANLCVDFLIYLIPVCLVFVLCFLFDKNTLFGPRFIPAVIIYFVGIFSLLSFTYLLSFAFDNFTIMLSISSFVNVFGGLVLFFVSLTLVQIKSISSDWVVILPYILSLVPSYVFYYGIYMLSFCEYMESEQATILDPMAWDILGRVFTVTAIYGFVFFLLVLLIEYGVFRKVMKCLCKDQNVDDGLISIDQEDDDVSHERVRVEESPRDAICIKELRKVFRTNEGIAGFCSPSINADTFSGGTFKVACKNLTLGIRENECFALLGPNGAGKSTVLNILTGDVTSTSGSSYLNNYSVDEEIELVHSQLGFCPQFDGLIDLLTAREHLTLYAGLKGISKASIPMHVNRCMNILRLDAFADIRCENFSGGTKRKLAVAISLIGCPKVIILDECSTGVDPVSKRAMWRAISSARKDRCVLLSTHSLEEADALATCIGIMVNGELKCLGTSQHLKTKFGKGYNLELHSDDNPITLQKLKLAILSLVPNAEMQESFSGCIRFSLSKQIPLSVLFAEVDLLKESLGLLDYSISQTTLEQVFITFAKLQVTSASS